MRSLEGAADRGFESCMHEFFATETVLAGESFSPVASCRETTIRYMLESEVDLNNYVASESNGERGDWVFRAPPSEVPMFDVTHAGGLATTSDGRALGEVVFAAGLETCFADAVYSALADEASFELETGLVIEYEPRSERAPRVEVLASPAASLAACVRELPWPAAHPGAELGHASIRLRVLPREVLRVRLVEALSR